MALPPAARDELNDSGFLNNNTDFRSNDHKLERRCMVSLQRLGQWPIYLKSMKWTGAFSQMPEVRI